MAVARAQAWTGILAGSQLAVETALQSGDPASARAWLALREFRTATRYSRAGANATLALEHFAEGGMSAADAALTVRVDLYDTYQARLDEALRALPEADKNGFTVRRAELAALVNGYFAILAPAYAEQRGTRRWMRRLPLSPTYWSPRRLGRVSLLPWAPSTQQWTTFVRRRLVRQIRPAAPVSCCALSP